MIRLQIAITILLITCIGLLNAQQTIDNKSAHRYFKQFDRLRNADNGNLWGQKLPRKMLFINPENYEFVANEPVNGWSTKKVNGLFYGQYPQEKAIANTSVMIDSTPWTMVMWPLSKTMDVALELMAHESFHNLQRLLDLQFRIMAIPHMDKKDARILFRLEMNALFEAVFNEKKDALKHALFFRKKRFEKYSESKKDEILLETQEGLAQYTGFKLAYTQKERLKSCVKKNIENMSAKSSLSRATAYTSGPLYGLLLDASGKPWRKSALSDFHALELAMNHYAIEEQTLNELTLDKIKIHYNYDEIEAEESARWKKRNEKIAMYTQKLLKDNPLVIELIDRQIGFNPNSIIPLGEHGNVYEYFVLRDRFGKLTAKKGALMTRDWNRVFVSKPEKIEPGKIAGDGWIIELKNGYEVIKTADSYKLAKTKIRKNADIDGKKLYFNYF